MNPDFAAIAIPVLLFGAIFGFIYLGFRFGMHRRAKNPEASPSNGTIEAAIFGLLALTLAFAFSGASNRFDVRRSQVVDEANAIGTAYLRLDLLPKDEQPAIRDLFRKYLETRIEVYEKFIDRKASTAALNKGTQLQTEIWTRCVAATSKLPQPEPRLLLLPALNDMFDISTTRTMATLTHTPWAIIGLLVVLSVLGAMLVGFTTSAQSRHNSLLEILFALAISFTIYVVLDLEYPRVGLIRVTSMDRVIVDLREMMK